MLIEEREVEVTAERTISSDESGLDRIQLKSLEHVSNHCDLSFFFNCIRHRLFVNSCQFVKGLACL